VLALVGAHRVLLGPGGERPVALLVVGPRAGRCGASPTPAVDRPVDVEDLEQRLQAPPTQVDHALQGDDRHRTVALEHDQHLVDGGRGGMAVLSK
jgi:hypothetical protein